MAVPRHKMSKMKQRSRRGQDALTAAARTRCPRCDADKLPHRVCGQCGFYRGEAKIRVAGAQAEDAGAEA